MPTRSYVPPPRPRFRTAAPRSPLGPAWLLAWLLLAAPAAWGQDVSVQASVDATTIGSEEQVEYTIAVRGADPSDVQRPEPPATSGLALLNPIPELRRSITVQGQRTMYAVSYTWRFRPINPQGSARLGSVSVRVGAGTYETDPINIRVVPQSQRPARRGRSRPAAPGLPVPDGERGASVASDDLFIRVRASQREAYQNEQVTLEYTLFFRQHINLGQSRLADSWDAEGFWREDLDVEPRPIPSVEVVDGLRYNTITLKRVAVFPTRAGTLTIDPLRIETEVYASSRDPFRSFLSRGRPEEVELASPPVRVRVKPLPPDAPPSFRGAVGSFRMTSAVGPTRLEVGEPVEVELRISGRGNLKPLQAPALDAPGAFEVYDPQVNVAIDRGGRRIVGSKTFNYVLVPRSGGTYTLPPIAFSYFDPDAQAYETLVSGAAEVAVLGSPDAAPLSAAPASALPVNDIAGLIPSPGAWEPTTRAPLHRRPFVYAGLLLPLVLLAALAGYRRHRTRLATDTAFARGRLAHPLAQKHLRQAAALLTAGEARAFYEELERAVLGYIGNALDVAERGFTRDRLERMLLDEGVPPSHVEALRSLLDECDAVRFSPSRPHQAAMQHALARAETLIATLSESLAEAPTR